MHHQSFISVSLKHVLFLIAVFLFATQTLALSPVGTDSISLDKVHHAATSIQSVQSLLIQQNGELLTEQYFNGMNKSEGVNIKSASKSIISLLVGIAIEHGFLEDVHQPIKPFFEDYFAAHPDSMKENITIKDLLTMRAGLETTSRHNYAPWVTSDNWVNFALNQPLETKPGGDMIYSTGSSHLLSVILTKATGMSTKEFADQYLFEPMNIEPIEWQRGPQGYYFGGNNLLLYPKDMLKIGQMVMNNGVWDDQQIISERWLYDSFQTYTHSEFNPYKYGYMWWKESVADYKIRFAWGWGGQYIFIIPELNAVVVMTGSLEKADQSRSYKEPVFTLLREKIIPFLKARR